MDKQRVRAIIRLMLQIQLDIANQEYYISSAQKDKFYTLQIELERLIKGII